MENWTFSMANLGVFISICSHLTTTLSIKFCLIISFLLFLQNVYFKLRSDPGMRRKNLDQIQNFVTNDMTKVIDKRWTYQSIRKIYCWNCQQQFQQSHNHFFNTFFKFVNNQALLHSAVVVRKIICKVNVNFY